MTNSLEHFGILGMRWGRRKGKTSRSQGSADHQRSRKLKKKRLQNMSNKELKELNERLELERRYKDLNKGELSGAKKYVASIAGKLLNRAVDIGIKAAADKLLSGKGK